MEWPNSLRHTYARTLLEQDILSEITFINLLSPGQFFIYKTSK